MPVAADLRPRCTSTPTHPHSMQCAVYRGCCCIVTNSTKRIDNGNTFVAVCLAATMPKSSRKRRKRRQSAVDRAGMLLKIAKAGNDETMTVNDAMKYGGFKTVEREDKTYRRQVYRKRDDLLGQGRELFASAAAAPVADAATQFKQRTVTTHPKIKVKKGRFNAKQASNRRKENAAKKTLRALLFKQACEQWQAELDNKEKIKADGFKYKPRSPETICSVINDSEDAKDNGIVLCARSVRNSVKHGRLTMQKPGEKGRIPPDSYDALCGAVSSYMILALQQGTHGSSILRSHIAKKVNVCVNKKEGARKRNNRKLFERIQKDIADDELEVGKPNRVEQRRNKWSTYYNLNLWFSSVKAWLIDMGFAKEAPEDEPAELVWTSADQGSRIANMDETGLFLDNTKPGQGGRPGVAFYNPRIAKAPTQAAHKSSYHCTMVSGSFASGEKFPEHFQIPTEAERDNQGVAVEFIEDMQLTKAQYLNGIPRVFSVTYGVNEKGGMNKDDFREYIMNNFVPLVANDVADIPGKRVVLFVDGGPGRTNEEMLMELKLLGIYLFPSGPPNTTHILQVSKQIVEASNVNAAAHSINPLTGAVLVASSSSYYRSSTCSLETSRRFSLITLRRCGSIDRIIMLLFPRLHELILEFWCSAHSTSLAQNARRTKTSQCYEMQYRKPSPPMRLEIAGQSDLAFTLISQEQRSRTRMCDMRLWWHQLETLIWMQTQSQLTSKTSPNVTSFVVASLLDATGYNGSLFRIELTSFSSAKRQAEITVPRSRARQDAIEGVKAGTGTFFQKTGGAALNDDDIFKSLERKSLREKLEKLQGVKKDRLERQLRHDKAFAVIEQEKADSEYKNPELKALIGWKLGKACPSKITLKADRLALWLTLKSQAAADKSEPWTEEEEGELVALEEQIEADIEMEGTSYGRHLEAERLKARSILMAMPAVEREALLRIDMAPINGADEEDNTSRTDDSTEHDRCVTK